VLLASGRPAESIVQAISQIHRAASGTYVHRGPRRTLGAATKYPLQPIVASAIKMSSCATLVELSPGRIVRCASLPQPSSPPQRARTIPALDYGYDHRSAAAADPEQKAGPPHHGPRPTGHAGRVPSGACRDAAASTAQGGEPTDRRSHRRSHPPAGAGPEGPAGRQTKLLPPRSCALTSLLSGRGGLPNVSGLMAKGRVRRGRRSRPTRPPGRGGERRNRGARCADRR
jgi:hypothetical protein